MQIDIVSAGPKGAYEYHVRSYFGGVVYNKENRTLIVPIDATISNTYYHVQLEEIIDGKMILSGSEPFHSGTGKLPLLYKIIITP